MKGSYRNAETHVQKQDLATFTEMEDEEARAYVPGVVRVDRANRPLLDVRPEIPGPELPLTLPSELDQSL